MLSIVIKILFGERVKVLGLVFGVAFTTLLVEVGRITRIATNSEREAA